MKNDSTRRVRSPTARWTPMPSLRSPAGRRNQRPAPSSSAPTPASSTSASTAATAAARTASGSGRRFMAPRLQLGPTMAQALLGGRGGSELPPHGTRTMATAIQVKALHKAYGEVAAVAGISFEVVEGECFALLGPNGAGKTTTLEILEGYRDRSGGSVEGVGVDRELTVGEVVALFGGYYPHPRDPAEVIELVGLGEKRQARCRTLSGGQQRRLDLALGIVGDPDLVFLDEPTTGFDPSARRRSWELIDSLRALGKTILLTTHYMDEAQNLADRVAILAAGRIVAEGSPASLGGRDVAEAEISFRLPAGAGLADLPPLGPARPRLDDGRVVLRTEAPTGALHALTGWALGRGDELEGLAVTRPSLEDVYLRLTGGDRPA